MITQIQAIHLLRSIAETIPDLLDCDGCFQLTAELADAERGNHSLSEALHAARRHMSMCPCCAYEYEAMLLAIDAASELT